MGKDTEISWTESTFNPWRGCTKVSHGCTNCYAEKLSHRNPSVLGVWGDKGTRVVAADSAWREPIKWDKAAKAKGERHRVFCASLADVFEDRPDLVSPRIRLFETIWQTPNLDWLLLTKRIATWRKVMRDTIDAIPRRDPMGRSGLRWSLLDWLQDGQPSGKPFPDNVWLGTSVENQATADERIPHLLQIPAKVRFLSMEPLLGPVDLFNVDGPVAMAMAEHNPRETLYPGDLIDWVIVGGESGHGARPMHPAWARSIRDQCVAAGVPFHFKQWGEWIPGDEINANGNRVGGLTWHDWQDGNQSLRVGKKHAGRFLDGRTWDQFPTTEPATHAG